MSNFCKGTYVRIFLDCRMAYWSGVGRYTRDLVRALHELPDIEMTLACAPGDARVLDDNERVKNVEVAGSPLSFGGMQALAEAVERARPDLVHCLHFPTPWKCEVPLVVTLQDLTPLAVPGVMGWPKRVAYRWLNDRAVAKATRIITPSDATARDVLHFFPRSQGKIVAIADAADDFSVGPVGQIPAGIPVHGKSYIFSMGNTKAHKDLPTLLDAFQRLAPNRAGLHLVLAGEEPKGYLDARLSGEPRRRAHFTGPINDDQLRALYAGATIFAFPSLYEGFGLPPLEAMAMGTPVVAADAASVPEVVGDAAVLVPPQDARALLAALAKLLDSEDRRKELAAAGLARARQFTWAHTAKLTAEVYAEVLR
ncbi:MAG TPA: glycosyltransferase family 1 protein [Coriobacteriia bacterium]|nr:glycosyltransferase family 1 protein [Coriobacteriia bacterium]